jgi:hypothetical protein
MANEEYLARLKQGLGNVLASNGGWDRGSCLGDSRIPILSGPGFLSRQAVQTGPKDHLQQCGLKMTVSDQCKS